MPAKVHVCRKNERGHSRAKGREDSYDSPAYSEEHHARDNGEDKSDHSRYHGCQIVVHACVIATCENEHDDIPSTRILASFLIVLSAKKTDHLFMYIGRSKLKIKRKERKAKYKRVK